MPFLLKRTRRFLSLAAVSGALATPTFAQATPESAPPATVPDEVTRAVTSLPPAPEAGAPTPVPVAPVLNTPTAVALPSATPPASDSTPSAAWPESVPQPLPNSSNTRPSSEPLRAIVARMNKTLPLAQGRVVVLKQARTLQLWDGQTLVKSYRVALGPNPFGHKQNQGDGRTPEGDYFVCTRNARTSAFHIFLGLSYPAVPDAERAVRQKKISTRELQLIRSRLASRKAPLWRTKLGGWVGIHGGSDQPFASRIQRKRGRTDWTQGCVGLRDREIEEISAALKLGARVSIRP
jgi:hypothetical protein